MFQPTIVPDLTNPGWNTTLRLLATGTACNMDVRSPPPSGGSRAGLALPGRTPTQAES